jgi:hypothetical protein
VALSHRPSRGSTCQFLEALPLNMHCDDGRDYQRNILSMDWEGMCQCTDGDRHLIKLVGSKLRKPRRHRSAVVSLLRHVKLDKTSRDMPAGLNADGGTQAPCSTQTDGLFALM